MNRTYKPILSNYYDALNLYLKKTGKEIPCKSLNQRTQDFIDIVSEGLENAPDSEIERKIISAVELSAFVQDLNHNIPHIFIEDENLINFLKQLEIKDMEISKGFITENDDTYYEKAVCSDKDLLNGIEQFMKLLSPGQMMKKSYYAVHSEKESYLICTVREGIKKEEDISLVVFDDCTNYCRLKLNEKELSFIKEQPMAAFAVNFLAYMKAFPECLKDGVPSDISNKLKNQYKYTETLKTSDSVLEIENEMQNGNRIIIPHFRKGHFRLLKSDYYKYKKGQIIFVKSAMVKGYAKTLEKKNPEPDIIR